MLIDKKVNNEKKYEEYLDNYLDIFEKTDNQPFIGGFVFLKDLVFLQDEDFLQNKINIIEYTFLLRLLKRNLLRSNTNVELSKYLIDPMEVYRKYNLRALLKYDGSNKFVTYYNQWIRKIKSEYGRLIEDKKKEFSSDIFLDSYLE